LRIGRAGKPRWPLEKCVMPDFLFSGHRSKLKLAKTVCCPCFGGNFFEFAARPFPEREKMDSPETQEDSPGPLTIDPAPGGGLKRVMSGADCLLAKSVGEWNKGYRRDAPHLALWFAPRVCSGRRAKDYWAATPFLALDLALKAAGALYTVGGNAGTE